MGFSTGVPGFLPITWLCCHILRVNFVAQTSSVQSSSDAELMACTTSPSFLVDPDAVDMESAEEGRRSEDPEPQRRGVAARCSAGVLSCPGDGAAPPARYTAARDVARSEAPRRCARLSRPHHAGANVDVVGDPRGLRRRDHLEHFAARHAGSQGRRQRHDRGTADSDRERVVPGGAAHNDHHHLPAPATADADAARHNHDDSAGTAAGTADRGGPPPPGGAPPHLRPRM
jgi:hypothetical protein